MLLQADHEGTGRIHYSDFKEVLKASGLGLTRKDINLILSQVRSCPATSRCLLVFASCLLPSLR